MSAKTNFITLYSKFCKLINRMVGYCEMLLMIVIVLSIAVQVFTRYFLNNSAGWTEEISRFCFVWGIMLGATICTLKNQHAVIKVIRQRLPQVSQTVLVILTKLLMIICTVILVIYGKNMVIATSKQITPALKIPMSYVYLSVPVSGAIQFLYIMYELIRFLSNPKGTVNGEANL